MRAVEVEAEVLAAAEARGRALGDGDELGLRALLHPAFVWTSHRGDVFDRDGYLRSNARGRNRWYGQRLEDPVVVVDGDVAVLRCVVADDVDTGAGRHTARMLITQTWVRRDGRWVCLAGHAGPRLD
ncbi:nuclear transport factor 2 family protein [Auraticoccus monumenti]|uniref:nuclear transport factor 2 family protein n=1 Tax=Auraticoccus monumenti TaxID=675864 RepID=UPI0012FC26A2|nr:nuclear transport factor 2 family protein [Auraticoccus monumenti]